MTPTDPPELRLEDVARSIAPGRTILAEAVTDDATTPARLADVAARIAAASGATIVPFDRSGARDLALAVRLTGAVLVLVRPERSSPTHRVVQRTLAYYASRIDIPLATVDRAGHIRLVEPLGRSRAEDPDHGPLPTSRHLDQPAWP